MKLLIDMNISPHLVDIFTEQGWQALHWSAVGDPRADDSIIMKWARDNGYVIFTHDLDAAKLYEIGKLSSGRAAELAGISRVSFLQMLARYNVPIFNPTAEELEQDLHNA